MFNPPHPGGILREDMLPELNLTVTEAAKQLGISRVQLSRFINERAALTPVLARRLGQWLGAPTARMWLQMQLEYDLWQEEHNGQAIYVEPAKKAKPALEHLKSRGKR